MTYTKEQIDTAVEATSPMCFILHVSGEEYCEAVFVAMQLSHDQQGVLSKSDKELITSLMP
jgi:hypothetical protein